MSALPPKADIGTWPSYVRRNGSGRLAIFAAIRRVSSRREHPSEAHRNHSLCDARHISNSQTELLVTCPSSARGGRHADCRLRCHWRTDALNPGGGDETSSAQIMNACVRALGTSLLSTYSSTDHGGGKRRVIRSIGRMYAGRGVVSQFEIRLGRITLFGPSVKVMNDESRKEPHGCYEKTLKSVIE